MKVKVLNVNHFKVIIDDIIFFPYKEREFNFASSSTLFRKIRGQKNFKINQYNTKAFLKRNHCEIGEDYNFCYDCSNQHKGDAYIYAIEALSNPIKKHLNNSMYLEKPGPGIDGKGLNVRYFSSMRIGQQGKTPVGPHDIFYSHGIADKNYWIGSRINEFNFAFVPGPKWTQRMRNTGYKGEIFEVGYTKLDPIFEELKNKKEEKKPDKINVLWLPTHGYSNKNKGRSSFPEFLNYIKLLDYRYNFLDSRHPTTKKGENRKQVPTLKEYCKSNTVVIADAGSTLYEAWALGIPVVFPDWICKKDVMQHFNKDRNNLEHMIYSKQIGYHAKNIQEMNKLIEIAASDGMKDEEKQFIENIFPSKLRGKSGETAAKALKEIKKSL